MRERLQNILLHNLGGRGVNYTFFFAFEQTLFYFSNIICKHCMIPAAQQAQLREAQRQQTLEAR